MSIPAIVYSADRVQPAPPASFFPGPPTDPANRNSPDELAENPPVKEHRENVRAERAWCEGEVNCDVSDTYAALYFRLAYTCGAASSFPVLNERWTPRRLGNLLAFTHAYEKGREPHRRCKLHFRSLCSCRLFRSGPQQAVTVVIFITRVFRFIRTPSHPLPASSPRGHVVDCQLINLTVQKRGG